MKYIAKSAKEMEEVAQSLIKHMRESRIFVFNGRLGAGKTTLIQAMCRILGYNNEVTSPTFALINIYPTDVNGLLYHMDLYRIESEEEALDLGIEEYLYDGSYCFIEWPDKIIDIIAEKYYIVDIDVSINQDRIIDVSLVDV